MRGELAAPARLKGEGLPGLKMPEPPTSANATAAGWTPAAQACVTEGAWMAHEADMRTSLPPPPGSQPQVHIPQEGVFTCAWEGAVGICPRSSPAPPLFKCSRRPDLSPVQPPSPGPYTHTVASDVAQRLTLENGCLDGTEGRSSHREVSGLTKRQVGMQIQVPRELSQRLVS